MLKKPLIISQHPLKMGKILQKWEKIIEKWGKSFENKGNSFKKVEKTFKNSGKCFKNEGNPEFSLSWRYESGRITNDRDGFVWICFVYCNFIGLSGRISSGVRYHHHILSIVTSLIHQSISLIPLRVTVLQRSPSSIHHHRRAFGCW